MVAVIVEAVRSPYAAVGGALKGWHPVSLLAEILKASIAGPNIEADRIQRVLGGCATTIGEQSMNVTRNAVLAAGWPETISASSMDGHAMAGFLAFADTTALVQSRMVELAIASGIESSTRVPDGAASGVAVGKPFGPLVHSRYEDVQGLVSPGRVSEAMAARYNFTQATLDDYAMRSVQLHQNAQRTGVFKEQCVPVALKNDKGIDTASCVSEDARVEVPRDLAPLFELDGVITAASFCRPADGAAALVVADSQLADAFGWSTLARVIDIHIGGTNPLAGDSGAGLARLLLERNGLKAGDVGRFEVFEDSAVTPLAFAADLGISLESINPDGGALATGAPLGAAATGVIGALAYGLKRDSGRYGLATVAGSGGQAGAVLLERI